jgi:hypothetical protein
MGSHEAEEYMEGRAPRVRGRAAWHYLVDKLSE